MSRELFLVILNDVRDYDDYFEAKYECTRKIDFSGYQKCSAAIWQLAYEVPGDLINDYMRMSESICHEAMYRFCKAVINGVWQILSKIAKHRRHCLTFVHQQE
jgi:hypothetical protein